MKPVHSSPVSAVSAANDEVSLVEILDHILHSGVVIQGSVIISLAGVDLVYLGVSAVLTSVETARKHAPDRRG